MSYQNSSYYLSLALEEAKKAYEEDEVPVGAVIVKDNKIISLAHNRVEKDGSIVSHAEILALQKAFKKEGTKNSKGYKIYITLEPCLICLGAIYNAHIAEILSSSFNHKEGALTPSNVDSSLFKIEYVKSEESQNLLTEFFKLKAWDDN